MAEIKSERRESTMLRTNWQRLPCIFTHALYALRNDQKVRLHPGASCHLHISSSALNRQLLELEAEVGTPLFERLRTELKVTLAGEILSRHVQVVIQDALRMSSELDTAKGWRRAVIEVVSAESLIADFRPRILRAMAELYPRVQVRVRILGSVNAAMAVSSGSAGLAICFIGQRMPDLRQACRREFSFGAIVAPAHPLNASGKVSIASCAAFPLILPRPDISMREKLDSLLLPVKANTKWRWRAAPSNCFAAT